MSQDEMPLRSLDFYKDNNIEILFDKQVVRVDPTAKTITFNDGEITYDSLLLATGGKPTNLDIEGKDLQNVFTLRSFDDIEQILAASKQASHAVVIGSSFIGIETVAGLTQLGLQVIAVQLI